MMMNEVYVKVFLIFLSRKPGTFCYCILVLDISYLISCSVAIVLCSAGSGCSVVKIATLSDDVNFTPSFSQVNVGGGSPRTLIWKVIILLSLTILDPPLPLSMDGDKFLYLHK